nr:NUDIX domain-containing protein [uncultured Catonella sp.]
MEIWDGLNRDGTLAGVDLIRGEKMPEGLFHLVCEVLVQHTDGDFLLMKRDLNKPTNPGKYEATAGGSALKGEDRLTCIKRELLEETGIVADDFTYLGRVVHGRCIFEYFYTRTDCKKNSVTLQKNETIGYKWIDEKEFVKFVNSNNIIRNQRERYRSFLIERGYISKKK